MSSSAQPDTAIAPTTPVELFAGASRVPNGGAGGVFWALVQVVAAEGLMVRYTSSVCGSSLVVPPDDSVSTLDMPSCAVQSGRSEGTRPDGLNPIVKAPLPLPLPDRTRM